MSASTPEWSAAALLVGADGAESRSLFAEAGTRHDALAEHTTAYSVVGTLAGRSESGWPEREALLRAIVTEYQRRSHRLWSGLLLAAFAPMLRRMVSESSCRDEWRQDLECEARGALLRAAYTMDLEVRRDHTAMRLRCGTRDRLRTWLRRERRHARRHRGLLELDLARDRHTAVAGGDVASQVAARLLVAVIAAHVDAETLDLLLAAASGERLRDLVRERYPSLDESEQDRVYQRLKKRRQRAIGSLRQILGE